MSDRWSSLSLRERLMVAIAGGLTLLVVFWQFMLIPTLNAKATARADLREASQTLNRVQQVYMRNLNAGSLATGAVAQPVQSIEAFKSQVTQAASEKGLSISRLQAGNDTTISLVLERVDPRLLFLWLEEVETRYSGQINRLAIDQSGDGTVRLSVDIERAG
ncbi:MAG: hypothetical protein Hens3KO_08020 [Henriciella sp.]